MELKKWFWLIYLICALYLLNKAFAYIAIPESLSPYEKWVFVLIAAFLLFGAYNSYKLKKPVPQKN